MNGVEEIKNHPWFVNDAWTWDTLRESIALVVFINNYIVDIILLFF